MGSILEQPQGSIQEKFERLTGKEKLEIILSLFGSESTRDAFLETCKEYAALRSVNLPDDHGEETYQPGRRTYSPPQRANLHNRIMDTLKRLSLPRLTPLQEKVLNEMASRENAGKIIREYMLAHEGGDEEEESNPKEQRRDDVSEPSYYHSLGREH